jgi:hypothetical protein
MNMPPSNKGSTNTMLPVLLYDTLRCGPIQYPNVNLLCGEGYNVRSDK